MALIQSLSGNSGVKSCSKAVTQRTYPHCRAGVKGTSNSPSRLRRLYCASAAVALTQSLSGNSAVKSCSKAVFHIDLLTVVPDRSVINGS